MIQTVLLRLHRWMFLTFAIPLAVIIVTGLILSFQPILQTAGIEPGTITLAQIETYLAKYDPDGKAHGLRIDHFEKTVSIQGAGPAGSVTIGLRTGGVANEKSWISDLMSWARPVHEHFVFDLETITGIPIVLVSTIGMVFAMLIGVLMGLPRIRNTIAGWHKATAWVLLPLLVLSPLTGVFMAWRITFNDSPPRSRPISILDAVRMIAQKHDLSGLQTIRSRGGRQMAIVIDGRSHFAYITTTDGLKPALTNWPRTFHQGDFFGIWGGVMNVMLSFAFILLLTTGVWLWARRQVARRRRARAPVPAE
jgi:uncharacterized iron-regulated membrane protein